MTTTVRNLVECLQKDEKELKHLETALRKEREALQNRDLKLLEDVIKVKTSLLTSLEQRAKQKMQILIALGYTPNRMTIDEFLIDLKNQPLIRIWEYIRKKLRDCQSSNAVNGKVVSHSQMRVNKMMQIVRGQNSQASLYTASGKERSTPGTYRIASA